MHHRLFFFPSSLGILKGFSFHKIGKHAHIPVRKRGDHLPICLRKALPFPAFRRYPFPLKPYRLLLQGGEGFQHGPSAVFIKPAAEMIQCPVIKILYQPVVFILHLQIHHDIGVFTEVNRIHHKHFLFQRFNGFQGTGKLIYFLPQRGSLFGKSLCHILRGVKRYQAVLNIIQ